MQAIEFPSKINVNNHSGTTGTKVSALRADTMRQSSQLIREQVEKLKQFRTKIENIVTSIQQNKGQCQQTISNLKTEISDLDAKIGSYEKKQINGSVQDQYRSTIKSLQGQYLGICKERVRVANEINIKSLNKVDIEDKTSPANQIFKWILAAIYNEAGNKFFWPNFKEQAFEKDKGKDFIERLGKVSSLNVTEDQKIKTQLFLSKFNQYAAAPEIQEVKPQIDRIHKIAQYYKRGYIISSQIHQNEKLIQKHKESTMQKDEQFMRWKARSEALKDRVHINEQYLKFLTDTEQKLQPKVRAYEEINKSGQKLKMDFQGFDKWNPAISLGTENKSNCQCTLF